MGTQIFQTYRYFGGTIPSVPSAYTFSTWINIYDIVNKASPRLLKTYKLQGAHTVSGSLPGGYVYLTTQYFFLYSVTPNPWVDWGTGPKDLTATSIYYYPTHNYSQPALLNLFSFNLGTPLEEQPLAASICIEL
jgi:hypothetical protein